MMKNLNWKYIRIYDEHQKELDFVCINTLYELFKEQLIKDLIISNTVTINGVEVPAPETKAPEIGTKISWITREEGIVPMIWDENCHECILSDGLIWLKREHAQMAWDAMTKPLREFVEGEK